MTVAGVNRVIACSYFFIVVILERPSFDVWLDVPGRSLVLHAGMEPGTPVQVNVCDRQRNGRCDLRSARQQVSDRPCAMFDLSHEEPSIVIKLRRIAWLVKHTRRD